MSLSVFLSHSHIDKHIAGNFKQCFLRYFGFEVFLAHEDLEISTEWNQKLVANLKSCNIFIPLISKNSQSSVYVNQEIGLALGGAKKIIAIKLDTTDPFGFLSLYQACGFHTVGEIIEKGLNFDKGYFFTAAKIFTHIMHSTQYGIMKYKVPAIDSLIYALSQSSSWKTSIVVTSILLENQTLISLSPIQLKNLAKVVKQNSQVHQSFAYQDLRKMLQDEYQISL